MTTKEKKLRLPFSQKIDPVYNEHIVFSDYITSGYAFYIHNKNN